MLSLEGGQGNFFSNELLNDGQIRQAPLGA